jgi:hypothetical protein
MVCTLPAEKSVNMRRGSMERCRKVFVSSNGHSNPRVTIKKSGKTRYYDKSNAESNI